MTSAELDLAVANGTSRKRSAKIVSAGTSTRLWPRRSDRKPISGCEPMPTTCAIAM